MKSKLKALLGLAAAVLFAGNVHAQQEINFGIISTDSSSALKQLWQPFLDDMSKATGTKINGFFATDYTGIIEGMRFGKLQVAWHGNKSAIEAVDRASGEVFAQFIDLEGRPGYYSYVITHRDSPLKSIDDMIANGKSLSFGMGDPQSTSGTLVPTYYVFSQRKLDPKNVFRVTRSANHGGNLLAVINKQVDVATNNSEELDKLKLRDPAKHAEVKILWTSPLIPRDPLVWRKDLPADMKEKIKKFIHVSLAIAEVITGALSASTAIFVASNVRMSMPEELYLINHPLLDASGILLGTFVVTITYIFYLRVIRRGLFTSLRN